MKTKRKWGRLSGALLCGTMLAGLLSMTAFAEGTGVAINETNFPDENFRKFVKNEFDYDDDNALSSTEIEEVTYVGCYESRISSLKGIEYFIALETLDCPNNRLSSLDVSQNTELKTLICDNNQLSSLDVSQNTALIELICYNNRLSSLDVSKNTALEGLDCSDNQLSSLDVSRNTELGWLSCYNNQLSSLDVSQNNYLGTLECFDNQYIIEVQEDRIFDLSTLPGFDVRKTSNWYGGTVDGNQLYINNGRVTVTYDYDCGNNYSATFTLKLITEDVAINSTNFPDDNFRKFVTENYDDNANNALSGTEIEEVTTINCSWQGISNLKGIEHFTALEELRCYNNQLTSLDVSQNTELTLLDCTDNQLTSLDVSQNTELTLLDCADNRLSSLDVSKNTALEELKCYNNRLSSLDVSKNTKLGTLDCSNNELSSLDVSQNNYLGTLECFDNQYIIEVQEDRIFDLSTLPGFDVRKTRDWYGGTVDGNQLRINNGRVTVTYDYDCGNNYSATFTLKLITEDVAINSTNFPDDNFRKFVTENYDDNANNALSGTEIEEVTTISCSWQGISNLKGIEHFTALEELRCYNNQLTSLDVSQNTELTFLDCADNRLSSLDVSQNTKLGTLDCSNNELSSLDVSQNIMLQWLYCSNNQYTIEVPTNKIFDLSTLPGFDVSKAGNWQGGTVDGNQLQVNKGAGTVTYDYDCGNNHSVTFTLEVKILPHPCVFDQKDIVDEALKTPADCTHDAVYYMSCACGEISTSEEETFAAEGTALGHDYATAWSSDKTNHWHECSRCQDKKDETAHTLKTSVTPATMTKAGKEVTKCSICEEVTNTKTIAAIKTVKLSKTSYTYDGKTKTPGLTVKDSAGKTIAGKYYKVEKSSGRKNVGKYTYKITFKGNYKGTKTLRFVINPRGTELISLEAESKGFTARWKKQATQTTGYEIRYATNPKMDKAQTVKITKNSKVSQKITKLSAKKKYYVQIRTYKKINTAKYYSGWSKTRTVTTRK